MHPKSLMLLIRKKKTKLNTRTDLKEASKFIGLKTDENIEDNADEETQSDIDNPKYDQYLEHEEDPYKTRAEFSCLWELYTLKQHFCHKIRALVGKFESNFLKSKENDFEELANVEETDLLYDISSANFYIGKI